MPNKLIDIVGVSKSYGDNLVLDDLNLYIRENEFLTLLGPSGCGKTTLLRILGGFENPDSGKVIFDGKDITSLAPNKRQLNTVFQKYALFTHMTIAENIAFGLKIKGKSKSYIDDKIHYALKLVNLEGYQNRYPDSLSGGQQQRIALAREIVTNPKVMLLDEPLSNLDPKLRESMRFEIKELQRKFGFTIIFVTHDQSEAMAISDRMMVCDMGNIMQVDTPTNLYNHPCNRFVHSFLGQSTFLHAVLEHGKAYAKGDMEHPLPVTVPEGVDREVVIATRPNAVDLNRDHGYETTIFSRIFLTDSTEYEVKIGNQLLKIQTPHRITFAVGEKCFVDLKHVMWYPEGDFDEEAERVRRQLV